MGLKNRNLWKYSFLIFIIILMIKDYYYDVSGPREAQRSHFKGTVEKVRYDGKMIPYVVIKGKEHRLYNFMWHSSFLIHVGDTIIKKRKDPRIYLIKSNTKDTVYFNDYD